MRLKLLPSKPEFALNAYGKITDLKIAFEEVILYVPRYTLNPSVINGLTPEEFAKGYTIYAFDLTADKELHANHRQPITAKNLRLELF
ncbi:MAG: hypothetical protein AAGK05_11545, partial [Pseudomonadota bacterium]